MDECIKRYRYEVDAGYVHATMSNNKLSRSPKEIKVVLAFGTG